MVSHPPPAPTRIRPKFSPPYGGLHGLKTFDEGTKSVSSLGGKPAHIHDSPSAVNSEEGRAGLGERGLVAPSHREIGGDSRSTNSHATITN